MWTYKVCINVNLYYLHYLITYILRDFIICLILIYVYVICIIHNNTIQYNL